MAGDALSSKNLEYCNVVGPNPENQENLEFHSSILLATISATTELDTYHRALVACLDPQKWGPTLQAMKSLWAFVTNVTDKLRPTDGLHSLLSFTSRCGCVWLALVVKRGRRRAFVSFQSLVLCRLFAVAPANNLLHVGASTLKRQPC